MTALTPDILQLPAHPGGAVFGLGTFDGVHRGHMHLIAEVVARGRELGLPACVLVLYRDPENPLFAGQQVITTESERLRLFAASALQCAGTLRLVPSVTSMAHDAFIREVLLNQLRARHLVVGWDFHYGHARVGNVTLLRDQLALEAPDCGVTVLNPVMDGAEPIKSTTIREWLQAGDLAAANNWLTVPYFASGIIVEGQRLGRTIGVPTANLAVPDCKLRPANGVYLTVADLAGARYWAATNVGLRPTVEATRMAPVIEAHLLDFEDDLYGRPLTLSFLQRLRPEAKFASLDVLKTQIQEDIQHIRDITAAFSLSTLHLAPPSPAGT